MTGPPPHFLVIGAAKSGTTSLFRYLDSHPEIEMPAEKELAYFCDDQRYAKGSAWYRSHWSSRDQPRRLCGEASPQYLAVSSCAGRIASEAPAVRLIALLRNPIDRAFAHVRHAQRHGTESRSFCELAREWASGSRTPTGAAYFDGSLYAAALKPYRERFPRERLRVIFTEHLSASPAGVVESLFEWLGVDPAHQPECLGKRYNGGQFGGRERVIAFARSGYARLLAVAGIRSPIEDLLPGPLRRHYRALRFRLDTISSRGSAERVASDTRRLLVDRYADDVQELTKLLGAPPPWADFDQQRAHAA